MIEVGQAQGRYEADKPTRDPYLARARLCASLTVPTLVPPENNNNTTEYPTPYQSLGSQGVNNLANKLLLALFPPNSPFFRFQIDDFTLEELTQQEGLRAQVEAGLAKVERAIHSDMESSTLRTKCVDALKQLMVAGNVLLYAPENDVEGIRVFRLGSYVIKRAPNGQVIYFITKEDTTPAALSDNVIEACSITINEDKGKAKPVSIYTVVQRDGNKWKVFQEINKKLVPGSDGTYALTTSPWIPLRYIATDNEDYGRSFVEEYLGDLVSLEGLNKAIVQGSAAAAKLLILVRPNGSTSKDAITKAPNGSVVHGNADDITMMHLDKFADFRVALETINRIESRLSRAFMLNTSVQRTGERVTAEEIRYMAGELDDAQGGVYSVLSQELQLPLVRIWMARMQKQKRLPNLPNEVAKPTIVTGLEALGRGHDLNKLSALQQHLQAIGQDAVARYLNVGDYISRAATSLGIDASGLVKSEDQIAQEDQKAQMMQMFQQNMPALMQMMQQNQQQPNS